ncbi:MAG: hypothetical protein ACRDRK_13745 [Pseudonocardia sp.]
MAVFDGPWWGVWWPWMLVWIGTVVSTVVTVTITIRYRRRDRGTSAKPTLGAPLFLAKGRVMDLYQLHGGRHAAALRREVEDEISNSRQAEVFADLAPVRAGGHVNVDKRVFRRWVEVAEPITVIGIVIDVLDNADDIVYSDLLTCSVIANPALVKALGVEDGRCPDMVRLRGLDVHVSVRGWLRRTGGTDKTITFHAPYGDPADSTDGPGSRVQIECVESGLRDGVPTGSFPAHCLGRVLNWEAREGGCLVIQPIAIF